MPDTRLPPRSRSAAPSAYHRLGSGASTPCLILILRASRWPDLISRPLHMHAKLLSESYTIGSYVILLHARRGTLLRFGRRASASSGLHERWSLIQPGRVPAPLCGMLLPFQAIPMQRTIEIENSVRGRQHAGYIRRLARPPYYDSRRAHRSWSGE